VENRLAERDRRGRPVHRLEAMLSDQAATPEAGRFRSPFGLVKKKVKVKPDGTW
jgi:hypothetical protein